MPESKLAPDVLDEFQHLLQESLQKIQHCVIQISEEQIWRRPGETQNSIGNLMLHVTGNLRQWCIAGIGGADDRRDRQAEFDATGNGSRQQLLHDLTEVVDAAAGVIRGLGPEDLQQNRRIQGFDVTVLQALFHTVPHCVGHTHQIIQLTRLWLGADYRFEWSPDQRRDGVPL